MSKRRSVVLNYNGQRLVLDTIAGYCAVYLANNNATTKHGIRFSLRTGETVEQEGNDETSRNKVLEFLDDYFKPVNFTANKCQVCTHRTDPDNCYSKRNCSDFRGFQGFEREKDDLDKLSN